MTIAKFKTGSSKKHVNKGQFGKKLQVAVLGLIQIWVIAFG